MELVNDEILEDAGDEYHEQIYKGGSLGSNFVDYGSRNEAAGEFSYSKPDHGIQRLGNFLLFREVPKIVRVFHGQDQDWGHEAEVE